MSRRFERKTTNRPGQKQPYRLEPAAVLAGVLPMLGSGLSWGDRPKIPGSGVFVMLWLIAIICAIGAAWQAKYHRLTSLVLMSVAGLTTVITFAWFSAPDLALTQLSVEAVTTVLILLGLRWLPNRREEIKGQEPFFVKAKAKARRSRDLILASTAGLGLALLSYAAMSRSFPQSISPFFLERALPEGGGTNVVNVMLVDFRGFDTLAEITVLGVVALTVYALLRRFRPAAESIDIPLQQRAIPVDIATDLISSDQDIDTAKGYLLVPAVLVRAVLPIAAVIAVYLFMRGHNEPGGGFVAGLVLSTAFILQYIVSGTRWVETHMPLRPPIWIASGLLIATATGAGALLLGYPFLTTHTAHLSLPLIGVNTAIFSPSGGSIGIGFSVAINDLDRTTRALIGNRPDETGSGGALTARPARCKASARVSARLGRSGAGTSLPR